MEKLNATVFDPVAVKMPRMKLHRVVFVQTKEAYPITTSTPVVIDFGWYYADQVQDSIRKLHASYPGYRVLRHFAIRPDEWQNGRDHKTLSPTEKEALKCQQPSPPPTPV